MTEVLKLEIHVDDKDGSIKIRQLGGAIERAGDRGEKSFKRVDKSIGGMNMRLGTAGKLMTAFLIGVAVYKLKRMSDHFIDTAASMERMQVSLDTITKGRGEEWFERLNEWALKMPVNTQKAIETFSMMKALGLNPLIADMTTLVDTTSALGGSSERLEGIARGLGKIQTKGRVTAEELMILTDNLVPAYEILQEELGLTAEQVANIGDQSITADVAIKALLTGMEKRFGGMSVKMQTTWAGLTESLRSYRTEFERLTMESGPMDAMKEGLSTIIEELDEMRESGELQEWAAATAQTVITAFQSMAVAAEYTSKSVLGISWSMAKVMEMGNRFLAWRSGIRAATTGGEEDTKNQQRHTADANVWKEIADERMSQIHSVDQAMETLQNKLSSYKYATTDTAEKVAAENDKVKSSYDQIGETVKGAGVKVEQEMTAWESFSQNVATGMQQNFSDLFFKTMRGEWESFEEFGLSVLETLQRALADMAAQQLIKGLFGEQGAGSGGIGGGGWLGSVVGIVGSLFGEKGLTYEAVFGAKPVFMSKGGIFDRPFAVPMANGGLAIGSEYGQREAIMPLAEMSSGHLGVRASFDNAGMQGSGSGTTQVIENHYHFSIEAVDADSFIKLCERTPEAIMKPFNSELAAGNRTLKKNLRFYK